MALKMSPKFVVLCSLAVGAIYTTGYSVSSQQGNSPLGAAQTTAPGATASSQGGSGQGSSGTQSGNAVATNSSKSGAKSATQTSSGTPTKSAATTTAKSTVKTATSTTKSSTTTTKTATSTTKASTSSTSTAKTVTPPVQYRYLNGTYSGSGSNRIGTVEVAVSIHSGKITAVQITGCYTHYPQYYIDPVLPNYVVAHQTTQIPYVSGATLSSDDFYNAVVEALSKAKNPNYKG